MNTRLFFGIMVRLVLLFAVGMLFTYFPDYLREFFGDRIRTPYELSQWQGSHVDPAWEWGARHYWYFWLCIFMFILTLINFFMSVFRLISKHYPGSISDV